MIRKIDPDQIQNYLSDESGMKGGQADGVILPETEADVCDVLRECQEKRIPLTISGGGTGVVAGRIPLGGWVLSTERLNRKLEIQPAAKVAAVQAGVFLKDLEQAVDQHKLMYPPDPTEENAFVGGNTATNASGSRSFKYGVTRRWVRRLRVALPTGDIVELVRGKVCSKGKSLNLPLPAGGSIQISVPTYRLPKVKHAAGYFAHAPLDAVDLFIGSEGTLGVILEVEVELIPKPAHVLSGVAFFPSESASWQFVKELRECSRATWRSHDPKGLDVRALEYFDSRSLDLLRPKYPQLPKPAQAAILFEQEGPSDFSQEWLKLFDRYGVLMDESWVAHSEKDAEKFHAFRHDLPSTVNETMRHRGQRKVGTDIAVPDKGFESFMRFQQDACEKVGMPYLAFGHIGDNHIHLNMLPRDGEEAHRAQTLYLTFVQEAVKLGGTVSGEHGIGKLKRPALEILFGESGIRQMAGIKHAFDPAGILNRGNIFSEKWFNRM